MPPSPPAAPSPPAPHYGTAASYTAHSSTPLPVQPRQPRASSAFSRLANIALTGATGGSGGGPAAPAAASSAGSPSVAGADAHPASGRGGALDALETIVHADQDRWKYKGAADDPTRGGGGGGGGLGTAISSAAGGPATRAASASRYEPRTRSSGSRPGWRARDLSESRSRERRPPLAYGDSGSGGIVGSSASAAGGYLAGVSESPMSMSVRTGWAGGEQLPPNASASAFSTFFSGGGGGSGAPGDSHFFPHGSSAFSFEASGVSLSPWDSSYRSSAAGSPSLFEGSRSSSIPRRSSGTASPVLQQQQQHWDPTATSLGFRPEDRHAHDSPSRSPSSVPSLARTSSPVGGGRKPKDSSRALRYSVPTVAREKGLIGLAKPPKEAEQGRVAVAGKTTLKILRVPYGVRRMSSTTHDDPTGIERSARAAEAVQSAFPASSIAARRSRSRGSPAPGSHPSATGAIRDGSRTRGGGGGDESGDSSREAVTELMDVRLGSKLGPTYLFSDVKWGYGATSNKIATSFSNGAVVLWDLGKDGSRLDQLKYEHDRAVNRVVFGGQTGNWLMSGGQDGQMKLWDIRESRPASMILKASSPIRHLAFSPSASQPFTLVAACASGTMIRYDVRYVSRQNGGATDRIAGHVGACLAMDWRDGFSCEREPAAASGIGSTAETAGGGREGGWVVTGGVDRTVKIWDFSLPTLSTKPVRTLYTSQPVYSVAWHPTRPTELASSPMPSLGLGAEGSSSSVGDEVPSTPSSAVDSPLAAMIKGDNPAPRARTDRNAWKNEIEVWDVRRPYFPKLSIKTDEPISSLLYNDDETIWATSKGSPTFQQIDIASDSYSLLDSVDRPTSSWNLEGDFAFLDDGRKWNDVPFDRPVAVPVDTAKFRPDAFISTVPQFDPDFSVDVFAFLADNLRLSGELDEICDHNAEISRQAGRSDASQLWLTLSAWLRDEPLPVIAPTAVSQAVSPAVLVHDMATEEPLVVADQTNSGLPEFSDQSIKVRRLSDSSSHSRPSRQSSANGTPRMMRRSGHPTPAQATSRSRLDSFVEEVTTSESDSPDRVVDFPELSTTSSDSEDGRLERIRDFNAKRLAASLNALDVEGRAGNRSRSSSGAHQSLGLQRVASGSSRPGDLVASSAVGDFAISSSSSDSDLDDDGDDATVEGDPQRRSRSAKIASMHASLIANRSRRPSSGQNTDGGRQGGRSRDNTMPISPVPDQRQRSRPRQPSARGSSNRVGGRRTSVEARASVSSQRRQASKETFKSVVTVQSLKLEIGRQQVSELRERLHDRIKSVLRDYADRGDAQLCATAFPILQRFGMVLDDLWVARVTKTYLDLLRRLNLHVPAAQLTKVCNVESLQALTQDTVVFHMSCGSCGKATDRPPHGFCARCRAQVTRCCVCHLAVESLFLFCVGCGHGAHLACLDEYWATADSLHDVSAPQTPLHSSHPSTPGIATPMQRWLWGDGSSHGDGRSQGVALDRPEGEETGPGLRQPPETVCPAACGHSPCDLSQLCVP